MAPVPFTSRQTEGEKLEAMRDFLFLSPKTAANGN